MARALPRRVQNQIELESQGHMDPKHRNDLTAFAYGFPELTAHAPLMQCVTSSSRCHANAKVPPVCAADEASVTCKRCTHARTHANSSATLRINLKSRQVSFGHAEEIRVRALVAALAKRGKCVIQARCLLIRSVSRTHCVRFRSGCANEDETRRVHIYSTKREKSVSRQC